MDQSLEKNLLRHIIKDPSKAQAAGDRLPNDAFVWSTSRTLYRVIVWASRTYGTSPNATEVQAILTQQNVQEDLASSVLVLWNELAIETPDDSSIEFLIDQTLQYHKRNLTEQALRRSVESLSNNQPDKAITDLKTSLLTIEEKFAPKATDFKTLAEDSSRVIFENADRLVRPDYYRTVKLGYDDIDRLKALPLGSTGLILGSWKSGKSILLQNMALNVATSNPAKNYVGEQVYLHSNEINFNIFQDRVASRLLQIPISRIMDRSMTADEFIKYTQFYQDSKDGKVEAMSNCFFEYAPSLSTPEHIDKMIKKIRSMSDRSLRVVFVDYFARMNPSISKNEAGWEKLGRVADELTTVAGENRVVILCAMHPNLQAIKDAKQEGKDIDAESLGLSSQPAKTVSAVFSWVIENLEEFERNGSVGFGRLSLKLSRNSMLGSATLRLDANKMTISEVAVGGTGTV